MEDGAITLMFPALIHLENPQLPHKPLPSLPTGIPPAISQALTTAVKLTARLHPLKPVLPQEEEDTLMKAQLTQREEFHQPHTTPRELLMEDQKPTKTSLPQRVANHL